MVKHCETFCHRELAPSPWGAWQSQGSTWSLALPPARNGMDFGQPCGVTWNQATLEIIRVQRHTVTVSYRNLIMMQHACRILRSCSCKKKCVHMCPLSMAGGRPMAAWTCSATFWSSSAQLQGTKSSAKALGSWEVIGSSSSHTFHKGKADDADANPIQIKRVKCPNDPHILRMTKLQTLTQLWQSLECCRDSRDIDTVVDTFGAGSQQ